MHPSSHPSNPTLSTFLWHLTIPRFLEPSTWTNPLKHHKEKNIWPCLSSQLSGTIHLASQAPPPLQSWNHPSVQTALCSKSIHLSLALSILKPNTWLLLLFIYLAPPLNFLESSTWPGILRTINLTPPTQLSGAIHLVPPSRLSGTILLAQPHYLYTPDLIPSACLSHPPGHTSSTFWNNPSGPTLSTFWSHPSTCPAFLGHLHGYISVLT